MPIERKLAAIMFTDIAGYTALSAKDSTKASELLKTQRDTLKPIVEKHGGSWMKEMGDGLLLIFDSATSAVECSIAIQQATKDIEDLNLRIGIHEGEVIKQDGDVIGDDVNVASRIEPFSAVGGVAISDKIYRAISSNQEFETKYIGKPKLKGVAQEVKVYCITSHELPETDVSTVSAKLEEESKFNIFAITGGILTAIGIAFWITVGVFDVSFGGKAEVPSVGILMMENLGIEDEEFWSSGMTNDLITKVAGAGLIRVAPLKEILNLDKELSIEEIAKKLRVKYILTHSFLIKDDSFDLWCKLENIETGVALFSNKISEPMAMATQMVGKLANDIVTSLKVKTKQNMMEAPTANVEAYEYYLQGMYKWKHSDNMEDDEIARGLLQKAIELDDNLIVAKVKIGWTYYVMGDFDKAMEIYTPALKQSEELGDKSGIGMSLNNIGIIYKVKGDLDKAMDYYERSLKILEELGDRHLMAATIHNIGEIYLTQGEYDTALDYNTHSLRITEELDYKIGMGINLQSIGTVYYNKSENEKAVEYLEKSLAIQKEIGFKGTELSTTIHLYITYKHLGKEYDEKEIHTLIKEYWEDIGPITNYRLFELLEDKSYLETAYNKVQEKASAMEEELAAKFLSYPIPKAIVEEWEKVK